MAATPYPAYGIEEKSWFCRPGKRSATRRNLQRPPIPPGLLRPVQRRIGAGNDFRPDWLDGWCETKSVCAVLKKRRVAATPYPAYGSKEKVGFVGRVSAAPPGVTYSDHLSRPDSFAR
ncbi:hypothetical protein, partial [Enterobacter intestinihominis]